MPELPQRPTTSALAESVLFGLSCAIFGAAVGMLIVGTRHGGAEGWGELPPAAAAGGLMGGTLAWRWIGTRAARPSVLRGVAAGLVTAPLGSALAWYAIILLSNAQYWVLHQKVLTLGGPPINPLQAIPAAATYAVMSVLLFGWLLLPGGAVIGAAYALLLRRRSPRAPDGPGASV